MPVQLCLVRVMLLLALAALEEGAHQHEEHRHEDHGQHGAGDHPTDHAGADGALARRARARGDEQRHHPQGEGQRGHHDGAEAQVGGFQRRVQHALALGLQVLGEFHDQDGVLRREPDDGHQADLEVNVVGHAAQQRREQHAQHAQRHHQHHRERDRPAFVQRRQAEEHRQQRERIQHRGLRTRELFLAGLARPLEAEARRQLPGELFHLGHGVTRGESGAGVARDLHRRIAVVAHGLHGARDPAGRGEGRHRHRLALGVEHRQVQHRFRAHPRRGVGLHHHPLQAALVREVVDVGRAQRRGERAADAVEAHPQGVRLVAVDVDLHLRCVFHAVGAHACEHLALRGHAQHLVAGGDQGIVALAGAVLQPEVEAGAGAQFGNGRRAQREDEGIPDAGQRHEGPAGNRRRRVLGARALAPVLQDHEGQARVLPLTGEGETRHGDDVLHLRLLEHEVLDLVQHVAGAGLRCAGRQLDVGDDVALVLVRQERSRQARVHQRHGAQQHGVDDHHAAAAAQQLAEPAFIAVRRALEGPVEPAEEAFLLGMVIGVDRLEQRGAQRRRERQRQERGERDRGGHRRRELAVDVAGGAGEERQRHEHRDQHHGHADHGARDLAHGLARGLQRRQPFLGHDPLDVLHHHDGVVHHDADHQHHAEHRQHVDREAHRQQCAECAQQGHGHHDGRDDGVAEVLQEQEHHDEHQHHGLDQRVYHLLDGHRDELGGVIGHHVAHALGEELLEFLELGLHGLGGRQGIRRRRGLHAQAHGLLAVEARARAVALRTQLDAGHVLQAHGGAVGVGAQHHVAELIGIAELPLHDDGRRHRLALFGGQVAQVAGGHLHVLRADGGVHLVERQVEALELGRVHPDAHRTLGTELRERAHAGHALQFGHDVARRIVVQRLDAHVGVLRREHGEHQEVRA